MKILKIIASFALVFGGILLFVFGEYDDSPGGQLLGVILTVLGVVYMARFFRFGKK